MKKIFAICLVAMLFAAGTVGARNHFNAPKTMNEWITYCQWDSAHKYYEDSVLEERTYIQEIDTVNNTVLVYAVEWNSVQSFWKSLHVHKYFYDAQGRLTLYLDCEPDSEDFSDYTFNDSTIYIYGNQERTEIRYYSNNVTTYMTDSTHYVLDAMDSVLEKVHYFYKNDSTILSIDKNTYTYDPASHLMLTDSAFVYDTETAGWFATTANIYTVNDGKYVSGIQYSILKADTMYRCEYVYDADNIAEIDFYYIQFDGTLQSYIGEKELYTYNDCGDVLIFETYGNNGDGFYFNGREQQFYTTKQIETAVEDVTEEPAVRDEVVVKKYMINGQLFIERNGITYDAQGRVVRQ